MWHAWEKYTGSSSTQFIFSLLNTVPKRLNIIFFSVACVKNADSSIKTLFMTSFPSFSVRTFASHSVHSRDITLTLHLIPFFFFIPAFVLRSFLYSLFLFLILCTYIVAIICVSVSPLMSFNLQAAWMDICICVVSLFGLKILNTYAYNFFFIPSKLIKMRNEENAVMYTRPTALE